MNGLTIDLRTTSDTPIYQQIAERIRAAILDGSLESDACLPPIRTMAAELRVSVITVKKAYELLERQGLLYAVTGRGSFVAPIAAGDRGHAATAPLLAALAILEPLLAQGGEDRGVVLAASHARLRLASVSAADARATLAGKTLATLDAQTSARTDPRLLALRVEALLYLERKGEARRLANDLTNGRYREAGFLRLLRSHGIPGPRHPHKQEGAP